MSLDEFLASKSHTLKDRWILSELGGNDQKGRLILIHLEISLDAADPRILTRDAPDSKGLEQDCLEQVSACEKASSWTTALALLQQMDSWKVEANVFSFSGAISACDKQGLREVSEGVIGWNRQVFNWSSERHR